MFAAPKPPSGKTRNLLVGLENGIFLYFVEKILYEVFFDLAAVGVTNNAENGSSSKVHSSSVRRNPSMRLGSSGM